MRFVLRAVTPREGEEWERERACSEGVMERAGWDGGSRYEELWMICKERMKEVMEEVSVGEEGWREAAKNED